MKRPVTPGARCYIQHESHIFSLLFPIRKMSMKKLFIKMLHRERKLMRERGKK